MKFYNPDDNNQRMTSEDVDKLFENFIEKTTTPQKVETKVETKPAKKPHFWQVLWNFIGFFTYKPIFYLAEELHKNIKSKITCYLLAVLGYASLIIFIIL